MPSYNGHISTHKPKTRRKILHTIARPTCTREIYERAGKLFFTVRSREKLSTDYAAEAAIDLWVIAGEVFHYRTDIWEKRFEVKENA